MSALTLRQVERRYVALSALQWLPVGLVIPVFVLLMRARGFDLPVVGALFAFYSLVVIVLELPTGGLADVLGRRRTLVASRVLASLALVGMAVAQEPFGFAAALGLSGLARALQSGPLEAWYVDLVRAADPEADVRRGISRAWAAEAAAIAAGAIVGGFMPTLLAGFAVDGLLTSFSIPYLVAATLNLAGLVPVLLWMTEPPRSGAGSSDVARPSVARLLRDVPSTVRAGLRLAARDRTVRLVLGAMATVGFAIAALEVLSPVQFAALLGGEERAAGPYGVLVTLAFFGTAGGSALAPRAAAVLGDGGRTSTLFFVLAAIALAGMAIGQLFVVVAAMYVAVYVFVGTAGPLNSEILHGRVSGEQRATLLSVASLVQQLGGMTGALIVPAIAAGGFGLGWLAAAAAGLVGASLLAFLPRSRRTAPAADATRA